MGTALGNGEDLPRHLGMLNNPLFFRKSTCCELPSLHPDTAVPFDGEVLRSIYPHPC